MVESQPSRLLVASSILVSRSIFGLYAKQWGREAPELIYEHITLTRIS